MTPTPDAAPAPASINIQLDGAKLRARRKHKELTITELAERVGASKSYISKIERGGMHAVHPRIVREIATALGIASGKLRAR